MLLPEVWAASLKFCAQSRKSPTVAEPTVFQIPTQGPLRKGYESLASLHPGFQTSKLALSRPWNKYLHQPKTWGLLPGRPTLPNSTTNLLWHSLSWRLLCLVLAAGPDADPKVVASLADLAELDARRSESNDVRQLNIRIKLVTKASLAIPTSAIPLDGRRLGWPLHIFQQETGIPYLCATQHQLIILQSHICLCRPDTPPLRIHVRAEGLLQLLSASDRDSEPGLTAPKFQVPEPNRVATTTSAHKTTELISSVQTNS